MALRSLCPNARPYPRVKRGASVAEIAEQVGKTEAAVAGLLRRGLQKLRQLMHEEARD